MRAYDVIGDIHGHADALCRLLTKLEYREIEGVFRHDSRSVIFVGDFIDRGPDQKEVLRIARNMCEAGTASAVMGNHEINAIAWATSDGEGGFLRNHSEKNREQHAQFLDQLRQGSSEYHEAIGWFRQLPVWLERPGLRVIHACWYEPSRALLASHLDSRNSFTERGLAEVHRWGSPAFVAMERLIKGPDESLPAGLSFIDKDGYKREKVRLRWWDPNATTFRRAAIGLDDRLAELPDVPLPIDFRYLDSTPVLFGHYWMQGEPAIAFPKAACLDFSVAESGYLTAYRWSGEQELRSEHLVHVPAKD
ncbi:MAG: metallophosphoesterase [Xanthobacteraceae bacterium]